MSEKHIAIIGAGPGGLTSAMILAHRGYKVSVFEKEENVGGRSAALKLGDYIFDTGPTFLMMTFVLREMFEEAGRKLEDYCDVRNLDPMYKLSFSDKDFYPTSDREKMKEHIENLFPGNGEGLDRFHKKEKVRYDRMYPCLQKDYSTFKEMFSTPLLKALPYLSLSKSLYQVLASYFADERLRLSFTFQAKYLGMSPWECPGAFTIIPYLEHNFGVDHVIGGLSRISDAMAEVAREEGAEIHLGANVLKVIVEGSTAKGVELENGEKIMTDGVIVNADFGHAMSTLFEPGIIKKWTPEKLRTKKYSCSTFMLYLGVDTLYEEPHHQIIFAGNYEKNITEIISGSALSEDMSIYVRNASITDPKIAPPGHSALYVLVPVPNNLSNIEWDDEQIKEYRKKVLDRIEQRTSMKDLRSHIITEEIITPSDWEIKRSIFLGATFNLGHTISQMLYFRPRNRFEEVKRCYLVGGGTHPGSGLPTIYESARITANLIGKDI
ncbi:phytoene desaturase family protein [Candidatus Latescibacterota bacterium]